MKNIPSPLLILSVLIIFTGCTGTNENKIYFLVGTGSPDFELAVEGTASQFMVTGPAEDDPYGEIVIIADGIEKGKFNWGGSVCEIGSVENPPKLIEVNGNTSVELFYGLVEMHPNTGEGVLLEKGKFSPGNFEHSISGLETILTTN